VTVTVYATSWFCARMDALHAQGCQDHENTLGDSVSNDNEKGVSVALFAISLFFLAFSYSNCL
jgi:hypothetical protein